jgi:hypothetical protein
MKTAARDIVLLKGTELLVHRCEKCVEIKADCIEKQ